MTGTREWSGRTGESWAAEWRRTDRSFGPLTDKLLARIGECAGSSVLDIGCGAGELSIGVGRNRPDAQILGVDVSPQLVSVARERAADLPNVSFALGDAAAWQANDAFRPDLLISRHGVMFFDDPVAAFAHLAGQSAPEAQMLFSCFRGPAENEIFTGIASLLPAPDAPPDPEAPGPMAFADPARVRSILGEAGWGDIAFEPCDFAMVAGAGEDAVEDAMGYFRTIGPAAAAMADMAESERAETMARLRTYLESKLSDGVVALGGAAWIVSARKGSAA